MEEEVLLRCLKLADTISSWCPISPDGEMDPTYPYDGMASVGVRWNPYSHLWLGTASWSSSAKLYGDEAETVLDAALGLEIRLADELAVVKSRPEPAHAGH